MARAQREGGARTDRDDVAEAVLESAAETRREVGVGQRHKFRQLRRRQRPDDGALLRIGQWQEGQRPRRQKALPGGGRVRPRRGDGADQAVLVVVALAHGDAGGGAHA